MNETSTYIKAHGVMFKTVLYIWLQVENVSKTKTETCEENCKWAIMV